MVRCGVSRETPLSRASGRALEMLFLVLYDGHMDWLGRLTPPLARDVCRRPWLRSVSGFYSVPRSFSRSGWYSWHGETSEVELRERKGLSLWMRKHPTMSRRHVFPLRMTGPPFHVKPNSARWSACPRARDDDDSRVRRVRGIHVFVSPVASRLTPDASPMDAVVAGVRSDGWVPLSDRTYSLPGR